MEYGLIVAIMSVGLIVLVNGMTGDRIANVFTQIATSLLGGEAGEVGGGS